MKKLGKNGKKITWIVLANMIILFFLILAFGREYVSNIQVEREIAKLEERREVLQANQAERLRMIQELSSEYYLERQAREKHGLAREGEQLIIVKDENEISRIGIETPEEVEIELSNLETWFYFFFDSNQLK